MDGYIKTVQRNSKRKYDLLVIGNSDSDLDFADYLCYNFRWTVENLQEILNIFNKVINKSKNENNNNFKREVRHKNEKNREI